MQFEVNTTIRFRPNDGKAPAKADGSSPERTGGSIPPESGPSSSPAGSIPRPEVHTDVYVKRSDREKKEKHPKDE